MTEGFNHFDGNGNAVMVDVADKKITERTAVACGRIYVNEEIICAVKNNTIKKGDVLGVARVAGIMGVKRTAELIPMCHTLILEKCSIDFAVNDAENYIEAVCTVKCSGKTGVEMEALTGANIALLTIYDMCKSVSKRMHLENIHLVSKDGGKSGDFRY